MIKNMRVHICSGEYRRKVTLEPVEKQALFWYLKINQMKGKVKEGKELVHGTDNQRDNHAGRR